MALEDFSDEQLREIYLKGRRTLNRLERKPNDYRTKWDKPDDTEYLPRLVSGTTNDDYFQKLVEVTFFIHTVAVGVEKKLP